VLDEARRLGAARLLVAGDLVGYYYEPDAVLDLLASWDWTAVRGNHEVLLAEWRAATNRDEIRARYGSGLEVACGQLTPTALEALERLPHPLELRIADCSVLLCHGTPWSIDEYVYPDRVDECLPRLMVGGHDIVVLGHTHYPMLRGSAAAWVVNPGSVGQPRDGDPRAAWALWDAETGVVTLMRTAYDSRALQEACREHDPQLPYLVDVLVRRPPS
jgi:predicted phosphodiesterase